MPDLDSKTTQEARQGKAKFWLTQIERASTREKKWRTRGEKIVKRYRDEQQRAKSDKKFNVLWANTELLKPAVFSRVPKADVRRRFKRVTRGPQEQQQEAVERQAAQVLENALDFLLDDPMCDFDAVMQSVRDDMLLPGRGVDWVVYEPIIEPVPVERQTLTEDIVDEVTGEVVDVVEAGETFMFQGKEVEPDGFDDDENPYIERLTGQNLWLEHVFWGDYREAPARRARDVWWKARAHLMTLEDLKEAFPELTMAELALIPRPVNKDKNASGEVKDAGDTFTKAVVWEIWNKDKRERVWVAEGYNDDALAVEDDPYGLQNFYPCAEPLCAVTTTDTRIPVPEFAIYQDQADELDNLTFRICKLVDACKVRGVYAQVVKEMANLMDGDDNEMFAVSDFAALQARGGLEGSMAFLPIDQIATVLLKLAERREQVIKEIYELTGISDIARGDTKASETFGAQRLKASFGTIRMTPRQRPMEKHIRDTMRIMAEIVAEHYTRETLEAMTGEAVPEPVMAILRDDRARGFVIDIETDSTVEPDAQEKKAEVTEFLGAVTQFFTGVGEIVQARPETTPLFMAMLKYAVRHFKAGRELEEEIDRMADQLAEAAQQPQQPDPSEVADAQKKQAEAAAATSDAESRRIEAEADQAKTTAEIVQMAQQPQGAAE